ncbi:MAG: AAA family ATPase [Bradymonadia bacterium]
MKKRFNTAGPCDQRFHYMLPAAPRLGEVFRQAAYGHYVVVHAPRQCGKTTSLKAIVRDINAEGEYAALFFSCEAGAAAGDDYADAQRHIIGSLMTEASTQLPVDLRPPETLRHAPAPMLFNALSEWASHCTKPLVLFFDEIDALRGQALNAVLRQLRAGYPNRPDHAPWSVVLCGLRDVRDYKVASGSDSARMGTASPFNIKVKSLTMSNFTADEVATLYRQHTEATGQAFEDAAVERAFELTQGQPWLVNSIAAEVIDEMAVTSTITADHVGQAKERLILARATHLDSLVARLHEEPVRRVLEPLISSGAPHTSSDVTYSDDVSYVADLGLICRDAPVRPANPIYREVMVRALTANYTPRIDAEPARFVQPDGRFDMQGALEAFAQFWVENGEAMARPGQTYPEATAQIVMQAFLQRVVNGGGFIDREYGVGRGRIDLLVRWPYDSPEGRQVQREVIELKRWATGDRHGDPLPRGLTQIDEYMGRTDVDHGWLIIFDMRDDAPDVWDRTHFEEHTAPSGKPVTLLRA